MKKAPEQFRKKYHPPYSSTEADGNNGAFRIPHYKIENYFFHVQISDGMGWEHASITVNSTKRKVERCPTWEEMCFIKDIFWDKDEVVIQYHPAEKDYISMHPFCLHLWKPVGIELPTPESIMVGVNLK